MKALFATVAIALLLAACGDNASKKGAAPGTATPTTPPPAEKKAEPKK